MKKVHQQLNAEIRESVVFLRNGSQTYARICLELVNIYIHKFPFFTLFICTLYVEHEVVGQPAVRNEEQRNEKFDDNFSPTGHSVYSG